MACRQVHSSWDSQGMPRCCMCCDSNRNVRCSCFQVGKMCYSCLPSRCNRCSPSINHSGGVTVTDSCNLVRESPSPHSSGSFNDAVHDASAPHIDDQFQWAFGASLLQSEGDCYDNSWCKLWLTL